MRLALWMVFLTLFGAAGEAGVVFQVEVVDSERLPLPEATVSLVRMASFVGSEEGMVAQGVADDLGRATIEVPEPGVYAIRAEMSGFMPAEIGPLLVSRLQLEDARTLPSALIVLNLDLAPYLVSVPPEEPTAIRGANALRLSPGELNRVRESVLRYVLTVYDDRDYGSEGPPWSGYCLGFDRIANHPARPMPHEFLGRFADHRNVHELGWCIKEKGRLLSVGPLEFASSDLVLIWSFSSFGADAETGWTCLHKVTRVDGRWRRLEGPCVAGMRWG